MSRTSIAIAGLFIGACTRDATAPGTDPATQPRAIASDASSSTATATPTASASATPSATPSATASAAPRIDCVGPGRRIYGTACCTLAESHGARDRYPGKTFLTCDGPRVGAPCAKRTDCDLACNCDPTDAPARPGGGAKGPTDGTTGAQGRCASRMQMGVLTCEIDERGVVGHKIID